METKYSKYSLGISLLLLGLILVTIPYKNRYYKDSKTDSFASEPINIQGFQTNSSVDDNVPNRIVIPSLSIDIGVKLSKIVNGYWEVFPDTAGWGEGSGLPGRPGNQVIFAHAREGLFIKLQSIKTDDKIYILSNNSWYSYEVTELKEVYPDQIGVIAPSTDEKLTLYTCSGYKDNKRLIVTAKRIDLNE